MSKKFKHLNLSPHWQQYFSKYPQGYTIIENLIDWVSQVDDMVDNQNKMNETVEHYGDRLDEFIEQYDTHLQEIVEQTLSDWQNSGFLEVVINEALDTKYHEMDERLTTGLEQSTNSMAINAVHPPAPLEGMKSDGTDQTDTLLNLIDYTKAQGLVGIEIPAGRYVLTPDKIRLNNSISIKGAGKGRHGNRHGTVFDFSASTGGDWGIIIGQVTDNSTIGHTIKDIMLLGNQNIGRAIEFDDKSYNNELDNIDIQNFKWGILMRTSWNNVLTRVTTTNCNIGYFFNGTVTATQFNACLAYLGVGTSPVGFQMNSTLVYSTFNSCATDGVETGVKITGQLENTGLYNFGFEAYRTAYEIDNAIAIVNVYGLSEWNYDYSRDPSELFNVKNVYRLNVFGVRHSSESKLLNVTNSDLRGRIRSFGSMFTGDKTNLDYIIQDNETHNMLNKKTISDNLTNYKGTFTKEGSGGFVLAGAVPNEGDTISVKMEAYGYSDVADSVGGGTAYYSLKNVGGDIVENRSASEGMLLTASSRTNGKNMTFRFIDEFGGSLDLTQVVRHFDITAIGTGTGEIVSTSSAFVTL